MPGSWDSWTRIQLLTGRMHGGLSLLGACRSHVVFAPRVGSHAWDAEGAASRRRRSGGCPPFWTALLSKVSVVCQ